MALKIKLIVPVFLLLFKCTYAQTIRATISGEIKDKTTNENLAFVNIVLKTAKDSVFVTGTITDDNGRFKIANVIPNSYYLEVSYIGYISKKVTLYVGNLSEFLDVSVIEIQQNVNALNEIVIAAKQNEVNSRMDKKTFAVEDNVSQSGGSVLQTMQNLPGVTIQDGKLLLRGNEKVMVLIDGKQTALTGFGNQSGLDNIPASAIDKIEIINNPSSKYDANGNGGIINIIYKKNTAEGWNGKLGLSSGLGALWVRKQNLPGIRPQYQRTPKVNPSLSLNYRKNKINAFLQADNLYTETLNRNEFVTRVYEDGTSINQQLKRNRNTNFFTSKAGFDYQLNTQNAFTISALFGSEKILDNGDQPFFNSNAERLRLWQFLEDELKTTAMATANYSHLFEQAGHYLNVGFNYTFHRENEKYFFDNILPTYTGKDAFKLLSDEKVMDLNIDYNKPLKYGKIESGIKFRKRDIPTNMQFFPGFNSPLDSNAGGWAVYKEIIPAVYSNYAFENKWIETEIGLRVEYVNLNYQVNPNHNTYTSNGYHYFQPFPTVRFGYKINENNKINFFYNRRVDRPNEVDIRIFPKYDDAEIIKVGNPALRPQFTNALEIGYKTIWKKGYLYAATYHRFADATITRIASTVPNSNLIYAVFQNAGKSNTTGIELIVSQELSTWYSINVNANAYHNQIDAFTVVNQYPIATTFSASKQEIISGNLKINSTFKLPQDYKLQVTAVYLAPDIIPQGKIEQRYTIDMGIKKTIQKGKGELFVNATDILNTMVIKTTIQGSNFYYTSANYYETQAIRLGYSYKF